MSDSIILRRCSTWSEAHICVGLLQSRGIWSAIDNAEHTAMDWGSLHALGGVHVRVFASDYERAKDSIIDAIENAPAQMAALSDDLEPIGNQRRWRAISMLLIYLGVVNFFGGLLFVLLDQLIPASWIPVDQPSDYWIAISPGTGIASGGPGAEGVILIAVLILFLAWELHTTRPNRTQKDDS